ncbi:hypothetical protein KUTeg_006676 [Tegillarca granosa]|uniref:Insulin-like domain-containing protein n=1 Tax=Tegillarca granosa TaxID=220873 RepID=A0ABQ9FB26_TEGGR|nr:hypothetical protein KUTeg_006676 [Tegillarca granosa]
MYPVDSELHPPEMLSADRWPIVLGGFLCLQVASVLGGFERRCTSSTYERGTHSQGICGPSLSDIVSLVCGGAQNINILNNKRDAPSSWHYGGYHNYKKRDVANAENRLSGKQAKLGNLLLGKKDAFSYFKSKRSAIVETGIVCECCYNSCSYYELTQYCMTQPPDYLRRKRSLLRPKRG